MELVNSIWEQGSDATSTGKAQSSAHWKQSDDLGILLNAGIALLPDPPTLAKAPDIGDRPSLYRPVQEASYNFQQTNRLMHEHLILLAPATTMSTPSPPPPLPISMPQMTGETSNIAMQTLELHHDQHQSLATTTSLQRSAIKMRKRTKTGCLTCRKRRIKCGEERPTCTNCVKSKRQCEGYHQRVLFKPPIGDWPNHPGVVNTIQYHTSMLPGVRNPPYQNVLHQAPQSLVVPLPPRPLGSFDISGMAAPYLGTQDQTEALSRAADYGYESSFSPSLIQWQSPGDSYLP
ncbi:hypothetical protein BU25DRAFT_21688 [Macroventuria anomochaeta]|uniref:Uncharacterized protein n=1 Tax=Macroventuria anomochaeta TaxID=301207 RepID=A0ACB6S7C5_9PLEO|nr:uncharacterized protein BU25DRAFT_21688 [Macroventuria anomochaeta]KAF2629412.1 hypothetical protein BU25DRAFT_21688 [Macroventuria anomochaeta]